MDIIHLFTAQANPSLFPAPSHTRDVNIPISSGNTDSPGQGVTAGACTVSSVVGCHCLAVGFGCFFLLLQKTF